MSHLLLNCDWLGLSVQFPPNISDWAEIKNHTWIDYDGTNVWCHRRVLVNDRGDKVATVLYEPKSSIINAGAGLIEVANEWLYHGPSPRRVINLLTDSRPFSITGINRLDLAVDFNPTDEQRAVIYGLADNSMYVSGKRSGSGFWSTIHTEKLADVYQNCKVPHCQSWGHKTSNIRWKLYYKSKELLDDMGGVTFAKPYILDCWREAELDHRDVWRLEVSIHNCNRFLYDNEPLTWDLYYNCNPRELYRSLYSSRFTVRKADGHKDRTNDTIVPFLPVAGGPEFQCRRPAGMRSHNGRVALIRNLIKSLEDMSVLLNDDARERVLWMIAEQVEADGLRTYFAAMVGKDLDTWIEDMRVMADEMRQNGNTDEIVKRSISDSLPQNSSFDIAPLGSEIE